MMRRAFLLAALLLAAQAAFAARTVMIFGDSLSAAYNLSPGEGWVDLLGQRVAQAKLPWRIVNASITGETTSGGASRLGADLKRNRPSVVVIQLGTNDALRGLPIAGMRDNLERRIRMVRQARAPPLVGGLGVPPRSRLAYPRPSPAPRPALP